VAVARRDRLSARVSLLARSLIQKHLRQSPHQKAAYTAGKTQRTIRGVTSVVEHNKTPEVISTVLAKNQIWRTFQA